MDDEPSPGVAETFVLVAILTLAVGALMWLLYQ